MSSLLRRARVGTRLALAFGVVLALLTATGATALSSIATQSRSLGEQQRMTQLLGFVDEQRFYDADVSGWQVAYAWDGRRIGAAEAVQDSSANRAGFLADRAKLEQALAAAPTAAMTARERELTAKLSDLWAAYFASDDRAVALYRAGQVEAAEKEILDVGYAAYGDMLTTTQDLTASVQGRARAAAAQAHADARRSRTLVVAALVLAAVLTVLLLVVLTRSVVGPLRRTMADLHRVAEGDLSVVPVVDGQDEFREMAQALDVAVSATRRTVGDLATAASEVSGMADELSGRAQELSAANERTTGDADRAARSADVVSADVATIATGAGELGSAINEISSSMALSASVAREAVEAAETTRATVAELGEATRAIASVVGTITAIAEQTNLLALNATIEAARAGEMGKGFAVVAGEVKELAQQTAGATEDITRKVAAIERGSTEAADTIGRIVEVIARIDDHQATIAAAVEEQTATTGELARTVSGAAEGTHEIAGVLTAVAGATAADRSSLEQVRASVEALRETAGRLRQAVGAFRL
ncbi:methyl-accepting chemotaxis protein [Kineococcus rhizosphaerae]|uniref:Methyl-accepting chemotaxis protein n=1 Tax=Kineococcus rhizosphaerae TaxID=559628 RepID=A0A2T0QWU2_9ACTN|nr:methyl-accepting chemotaxis protein [Kineococcus rhizosphaerae]PRY10039.1 methyl-accepting chemotaxis protein [Kineococcus rhizosphaerae]